MPLSVFLAWFRDMVLLIAPSPGNGRKSVSDQGFRVITQCRGDS
jgi:hypothetical protein